MVRKFCCRYFDYTGFHLFYAFQNNKMQRINVLAIRNLPCHEILNERNYIASSVHFIAYTKTKKNLCIKTQTAVVMPFWKLFYDFDTFIRVKFFSKDLGYFSLSERNWLKVTFYL